MKTTPLDPELIRDRLGVAQGKQYWRSLEELASHPGFEEMLHREFPRHASEWVEGMSRRRFLGLMGASLALAGLGGCMRRPDETIMPYVKQPENIVLGKPLYYATTRTLSGYGTGVLVESHEGRPTKIEGNPQHPASRGATDVFGQAAILDLYDPDRSQTITYREQVRTWPTLIEELRRRLSAKALAKGQKVALLTEAVGSPTMAWQLGEFLKDYPEAKWFRYEPVSNDNAMAGAKLLFGKPLEVHYQVAKADVIVSLNADLLGRGPGHLAYARDYASRRREGGKTGMNRLYVVEPSLTITGSSADNRLALGPMQIENFARALARRLEAANVGYPILDGVDKWLGAITSDLTKIGIGQGKERPAGSTLVVAGEGQPAFVHALALAVNLKLGNVGSTVKLTEPILAGPAESSLQSLKGLARAIESGEVDTLLILGGNPVYTAPDDLHLSDLLREKLLQKDWLAVHLGAHQDETSRLCHWHIPEAHFLESWSDARAFDGTASIVQPLIAPLYAGRSSHEVLSALSLRKNSEGTKGAGDYDERTPFELVRDYWRDNRPAGSKGDFETFWKTALHDGVIADTAFKTMPGKAKEGVNEVWEKAFVKEPHGQGKFQLNIAPDPATYDGRFATNGWLQEFPKPVTRLTWDNAALFSPETAKALGLSYTIASTGGEHGNYRVDTVRLKVGEREIEAAAWILPGQAKDAVTLHLGYGRTRAGKVGTGVGFNANRLRSTINPDYPVVEVTKVPEKKHTLACVQGHSNMEGRDIVRSATLEEYKKHPDFAAGHGHEEKPSPNHGSRHSLPTLYPDWKFDSYKWGMAIDLSSCIGCGACVVACQAENNIPVVGKEQVTRGREMHWLRIDRYFESPKEAKDPPADQLRVHFQPVACVHCENAPCELVCPVEATIHGDEGTNDMVYNRCVGTRYCSNNCPYKVRRFNFFQYADYHTPSFKLMYNPDVTVRTRGVMEKCTYCIQRISYARIEASKEALDELDEPVAKRRRVDAARPGVPYLHDGEVVSACQAACPTEAIIFGDLNDKKSRVHRLHESTLSYGLLAELGTRPRTTYLAAIRNPNPVLGGE
jgi:molybdopterin-containing oxidoreductase family iron-sulfur binding subunit